MFNYQNLSNPSDRERNYGMEVVHAKLKLLIQVGNEISWYLSYISV